MNNMMISETIEELRKLKDDLEEISEVYDIKSSDTIFVLNKAIIACEQLRKYRKKAKRWKRKYQKQTDEIKVGDEVYDKYNPYPRVVTSINKQDMADLIDARGNAHSDSVFCLKKTGRHFPQIAEVLEQMRKESEYHADPYHADFAWDVKTVIDNFRKESESTIIAKQYSIKALFA